MPGVSVTRRHGRVPGPVVRAARPGQREMERALGGEGAPGDRGQGQAAPGDRPQQGELGEGESGHRTPGHRALRDRVMA
jgi:hypothetical protein